MINNFDDWPILYKDRVILGNPHSNVGIATLWTQKEIIADNLDPSLYSIIANFYDAVNGIEPLVRNCLANPRIRYILLIGNDRSKSKSTLINFFQKGVDKNNKIIETNVELPKEIPNEEVKKLINNVQLFDLTEKQKDVQDPLEYKTLIMNCISTLKKLDPYDIPKYFETAKIKVKSLPSSNTGFRIEEKYISDGYLKILDCVSKYGNLSKAAHEESSTIKECINIIVIIKEEDPDNPIIKEYMRFNKEDLEAYYIGFCSGDKQKDASYTYGQRFFGEYDQKKEILEIVKDNIFSKRLYITTWKMGDIRNKNPPCVISFQLNVQGNKLYATAYIRSNDMFRAWPLNAFGLRKIQKNFLEEINKILKSDGSCKIENSTVEIEDMLEMGPLTIISHSAHVYKENFKEMDEIVEKYNSFTPVFYDSYGFYTVKINSSEKTVILTHMDTSNNILREISGKNENELMSNLCKNYLTDNKFHLLYIGKEISKAFISLRNNISYIQDDDIILK